MLKMDATIDFVMRNNLKMHNFSYWEHFIDELHFLPPFSDPGGQKGAKITRTGKKFENRPIVRFLVTIGDYKSTEKRELPQYPRRAWLICQTVVSL